MDLAKKDGKRYVTIEFPGNNRATKLYNSCTLVGFETLIPIDFELYYRIYGEYKWRNKGSMMKDGKLKHLIAPYYNIKYVNKVLFACDPVEVGVILKESIKADPPIKIEFPLKTPQPLPDVARGETIAVNKNISLSIPIMEIEKQLFIQGYKLTKL